jgi:phosphoribosylformylglycinamidine (FGAM) synthase-like amidotransferase family enzyme
VYGMMPHPERCADPLLGNADGLRILQSLVGAVLA